MSNAKPKIDERLLRRLEAALDPDYFLSVAVTMGPQYKSADGAIELYRQEPSLRILDPNPFFEEAFYRRTYPDVSEAIQGGHLLSGLAHFLLDGGEEGRTPNSELTGRIEGFDSSQELDSKQAAYFREFQKRFPYLSVDFLSKKYRLLSAQSDAAFSHTFLDALTKLFDPEFYVSQCPEAASLKDDEKLKHYLREGVKRGFSPLPSFDEHFYLSFYDDIREAVDAGALKSGFEHYMVSGQREGRLPKHELKKAIEVRHRGLTDPVGVRRVEELERKIARPNIVPRSDNERVVHIVVPDLNPDIEFAGYKSLIEIALEMSRRGKKINFIKTFSSSRGINYFLYHNRDKPEITELLGKASAVPVSAALEIGRNDRVLAYSSWDTYVARSISQTTSQQRHSFLIQEYEPIFYDYNSFRFLCDQSYRFPHFAIFNSELLKDYFKKNRLGVFRNGSGEGDFMCFEHYFTPPAKLDVEDRPQKNFFLYARPESHAGRNLFEVSIMALRRFLASHKLADHWNFVGLGAFTDYTELKLSDSHVIKLQNRLPFEEYSKFIQTVDVGMSLMYAPHPSVLPFELLARGAVVVTNTFENRDKDSLTKFGKNLIMADTTMTGLVSGLAQAFELATDYDRRIKHAYVPTQMTWSTIASDIVDVLEKEDLA